MNLVEPELEGLVARASWSRRGFVVTTLASGFALAVQPVAAAAIHTDANGLVAGEILVPVAGGHIPAYRAMPETGGPFPTLLVVEEIFGVHEHIQDICRRLAKLGYYAVAPELFAREGDPVTISDVPTLIKTIVSRVPDAQAMSDLDATVAAAGASGSADLGRLGITGFCWGGRMVWLYAEHNPELKAAVAWYGPLDRARTALQPHYPVDLASALKAPVLGLYGGADQSIPRTTIDAMTRDCAVAHKICEFKIYPDAPHGFNADYRPSYRPADAADGWARMLAWFKRYGVA